jgi:hypothetical protein
MPDHSREDKLTALMVRTAGALARSMRCLEETRGLVEASQATLNNPGAVSEICSICGKSICLEMCTTDEHGCAVHEECYVAKLMVDPFSFGKC